MSDAAERLIAAEITREQVFLQLHDELPHASTVETEGWEERRDGSVRIDQVLYVERPSERAIVLWRRRPADQGDRRPRLPRAFTDAGAARAPVSVRQGPRELGRGPRTLRRNRPRRLRVIADLYCGPPVEIRHPRESNGRSLPPWFGPGAGSGLNRGRPG